RAYRAELELCAPMGEAPASMPGAVGALTAHIQTRETAGGAQASRRDACASPGLPSICVRKFPLLSARFASIGYESCLMSSKPSWPPPVRNLPTCGGFFEVARVQKRLGDLDAEMAKETFWNSRDQAQKLIDEAGALRRKIEPLITAEKQLDDFRVMVELAEGEPEAEQIKHQQALELDFARFSKDLDALELAVLLGSPHDKNNCILSINAGAGGTESCDWANMLLRMYQRWCERRGWKVEVTDALAGEV